MDKLDILKSYFGYDAFREGQEALIDSILAGQDAVGIMPTGAGKSLCFQVPALLLEGVTLVISPLISLMKDQVGALVQAGVPAAYINSSLSLTQCRTVLERAGSGAYKLLYIAPERLETQELQEFAAQNKISMISVDEAHCVSQWGQDFRPSYLRIRQFIDTLSYRPVISAFTATATTQVREDIIARLSLHKPAVVTTGFDRPNLYFEVQKPRDKLAALLRFLQSNPNQSGIVYCSTRKAVEEVCERLCMEGYAATRYHAGLGDVERRENQDAFLYDTKPIIVATNAFGMGIDKSNVSFVVHYNMPKNIESYYQEAGRAGRDGQPAQCILFYSGRDVVTNQYLIDYTQDNAQLSAEEQLSIKAKERERLKQMTYYCTINDCLRAFILRYFGENSGSNCANCSNCNHLHKEIDITIPAQKILSCVARMREKQGVKMVVDTLRGHPSERILNFRMNELSTYGIMADTTARRLREIIQSLIAQGYLQSTDDKYPILKLTARSGAVLFHGEKVRIQSAGDDAPRERKSKRAKAAPAQESPSFSKSSSSFAKQIPSYEPTTLFGVLCQLRNRLAKEQNVPAYCVFTNATLANMSDRRPETPDDFLQVSGVGQKKLEKYGSLFLALIHENAQMD